MLEARSYSDAEILEEIKEIIGKVVLMSPDEISDDASLVDDIGMESIDFLDVAFRLEETFGISLPRQDFVQRFVDRLGPGVLSTEGKISPQGVKLLRLGFPEVDPARIHEGMNEGEVFFLVSAKTYLNLVKRGLEIARWKPQQCDKCQGTDLSEAEKEKLEFPEGSFPLGPVFVCAACNNMMLPPEFDQNILDQFMTES
jgi:acyl carrier protein